MTTTCLWLLFQWLLEVNVLAKIRTRKETGFLFFDFRWLGRRCREQTLMKDTAANRKQLTKLADKMEAEIKLGTFDYATWFPDSNTLKKINQSVAPEQRRMGPTDTSTPLFEDFVEVWLQQTEITWRHSTAETNRSALNKHIIAFFAGHLVGEIGRKDILAFRNHLSRQGGRREGQLMTAKTVNNIVDLLNVVMTEAGLQYDFMNPCIGVKRLKVQRKDISPFSLGEVNLILERVRSDYRNYFLVRFLTGMRTGEIHGLKWNYIDFERRQVLVRETYSRGRSEYTKTDGSQREIQMSGPVYKALLEQREANQISEFVFCTKASGPLDTKNVTDRVWYPLLDLLGLDRRRPYHCRHTAATLWLAAGENPEWIARQLGHASTEMLFRVYSRFIPNLTRQDGAAFDAMISQNKIGGEGNG